MSGAGPPCDSDDDPPAPFTVPVFAAAPVRVPLLSVRAGDLASATDTLPFSAAGLTELKLRLDGYIEDLISEAQRVARRHQADVISPAYVREAGNHLSVSTRRKSVTLAGSFGWVLLGAAVPGAAYIGSADTSAPTQVALSAICGILGAILITVQVLRD